MQQTSLLAEVARLVLASTDTSTLLTEVMLRFVDAAPFSGAAAAQIAGPGGPFVLGPLVGASAGLPDDRCAGLLRIALDQEEPVVAAAGALAGGALAGLFGDGTRSVFLVPLVAPGERLGVLVFGSPEESLDPGWEAIARVVGLQVGQAMSLRRGAVVAGELRAEIARLGSQDALTGLPSAGEFDRLLREAIDGAGRLRRILSIAFLDLDRFRNINDTLGHDLGDRLLGLVAARLRDHMGDGSVFRRSGDEFLVLLRDVETEEDAVRQGAALRDHLREPFSILGDELFVTAAIGIAIYPYDGEDAATLLKSADSAMYRAKERGGDDVQLYAPSMGTRVFRRLTLETGLRRALERGELILHYQPIVRLATGEVGSVEALARWRSPDLGVLFPTKFMSLAEETGLVVPIGEWVLRSACEQVRLWSGDGFPTLRVSVNMGARQFQQPDLAHLIEQAAKDAGIEPSRLQIEITESVAMRNPSQTVAVLHDLRGMGHRPLVAQLPSALRRGHPQARPGIREGHHTERRRRGDRLGGCRARPQSRAHGGGRGSRNTRAARVPSRARLPRHAGVPVQPPTPSRGMRGPAPVRTAPAVIRRALVTGATGFIGGSVAERLRFEGWDVRALVRPATDATALVALGVEVARGDLGDRESLEAACRQVEVVYHVGALVTDWAPRREFVAVNVEGARALAEAAARAGVSRFVHVSTTDVYGFPDRDDLDEDAPMRKRGWGYPDSKIEGEAAVRAVAARARMPLTVVRPATVFGPRSKDFVVEMGDLLRSGSLPLVDRGRALAGFGYGPNLAAGIVLAGAVAPAAGRTYNLHDSTGKSWADYTTALAGGIGARRLGAARRGLRRRGGDGGDLAPRAPPQATPAHPPRRGGRRHQPGVLHRAREGGARLPAGGFLRRGGAALGRVVPRAAGRGATLRRARLPCRPAHTAPPILKE
ncbi:MAG: diguanylate cyclase [Acidobacteria bacterium]|nr:diguanylate cyclase [Acidobacteriota bacterium]